MQAQTKEIDDVLAAIVYLADRCNGASTEDGAGFNKFDANNGHRMANIIRNGGSLSMLDFARAQSFVRKYHRQLSDRVALPSFDQSPNRDSLNEQQSTALQGVINWFDTSWAEKQAIIVGYAGTGKTFTVQKISKYFQSFGKKTCFTSPTHKANQVLSQMSYDAGLSVDVMTIHSLLGLTLKYDKFGKQKIVQSGEDKSYKYDLVVIDEGSMIGSELNGFIENMQCRYLVMGDPAQLPPIDDDKQVVSPVFSIPTRWDLTKVVRYDGAIFRYVTDIRENITSKKLPFHKYERNVFDKFASDEWLKNLIQRYQKMLMDDAHDPNAIRALAWTNKRVQDINVAVRTTIFGADSLPYRVNERLVAKDLIEVQHPDGDWRSQAKWATGSNTVLMHSCDECVINDVYQGTKKVFGAEFSGWYLDITTDLGDKATIFVVDESEKKKVLAVCGGEKKKILETHLEKHDRAEMWRIWYKGLNELGLKSSGNSFMRKLQYAFALTIHQSQGSTFKCVFADTSNVFGCQDVELRNKLLYVQGSRASQELYLLNNF